jgi:hypothetical protein
MQAYRVLGASLGWFAVLAQYWLSTSESGLLAGSIRYFGYFTLLGNIQVAFAFTAPLLPNGGFARFFRRPGVRTAIGVYILVIAVIYYLLLRKLYDPTGLGAFVNVLLHYVMPPLYLADWVMFVPKESLAFRQIPYWLIFPLLYAGATLLHGAYSGYYPYPFLDAGKYGYHQVAINIAVLTAFFLLVSTGFVAAGRLFPRSGSRGSPAFAGDDGRGG